MVGDIVGRDGERGVVHAFLEGVAAVPTAFLLEGEAGMTLTNHLRGTHPPKAALAPS
jgi:hypothetical protein